MAAIRFYALIMSCWVTFVFSLFNLCLAQSQQRLSPATLPLAVRSPYLSSWESALTSDLAPLNQWPVTWPASPQTLGWFGAARVDGKAYRWLGNASPPNVSVVVANATAVSITPTRTIFSIPVGPICLNVTFLSPIEPGDLIRQSIPFSYMYVDASSMDGKPHDVQVYSDISAEWTAPDRSDSSATWSTTTSSTNIYHAIVNSQPIVLNETEQQAHWGTSYYAAQMNPGLTYQTGADVTVRSQFIVRGNLTNQQDTDFRGIYAKPGAPVFAMAQDMGNITSSKEPAIWAVGFTRSPSNVAVRSIDLGGITLDHQLYYVTAYSNDGDLIKSFLNDFGNASQRADTLDAGISADARAISSDYADIVSLAARQVYGAMEITIGANASDCMIFVKNHGGLGSAQIGRVNPVETIFASFPMFMYLDPTLGRPLLEPLLRFQSSEKYTNAFAASDIGSGYPIAQASLNSSSQQGVEQTANMLIMMYAYARTTGDGDFAAQYYGLLKTYTDYLVNNTLFTANQTSADHRSFANQTNLAIKGIIGIAAMSELSTALGQTADAQLYKSKSSSFITQWETFALSPSTGAMQAAYGHSNSASWSLGYNLYADRWLGQNLLNSSVYDAQTRVYANLSSSETFKFGLPVDSTDLQNANSTWNLFAAAIATDKMVQNQMISLVRSRASLNNGGAYGAFPVNYGVSSGQTLSGVASPAQGAVFAPLALNVKAMTIKPGSVVASNNAVAPASSRTNAGAIAGAVIGIIVSVSVVLGGIYWYRRRRAQRKYNAFLQNLEKERDMRVNPFADPVAEQMRAEMSTTIFPPRKAQLGPDDEFDPEDGPSYPVTGVTTDRASTLSRTNSAGSEELYVRSQTAMALKAFERFREMRASARLSGASVTDGLPMFVRPRLNTVESSRSEHARSPSALKALRRLQEIKANSVLPGSSLAGIPDILRPGRNPVVSSRLGFGSMLEPTSEPTTRPE